MDGWSTARLIAEVLHYYQHQTQPVQLGVYRDYLRWLQQQDLSRAEPYWRNRLRDLTEPTHLRNVLPRSAGGEGLRPSRAAVRCRGHAVTEGVCAPGAGDAQHVGAGSMGATVEPLHPRSAR